MEETAQFILIMDRFYDCLNVRECFEGDHRWKPDLMPFNWMNDLRFQVLYLQKINNLDLSTEMSNEQTFLKLFYYVQILVT